MTKSSLKTSIAASAVVWCALSAGMASAQSSDRASDPASSSASAVETSGGLSQIVVTATRRATNVQNVPGAVSAVSGTALRNAGLSDPSQLSGLAPSLNVDQGTGAGDTHVSIRGLASSDFSLGASSPVSLYIDDIYQPFSYGIGTSVFDLNRIEVLRGPQGTLFGKNTTGGALAYYSQTPLHRDEGYLQFEGEGGDYGRFSAEGALNKVLTPDLDARFSFRADHRDDYIANLANNSSLGHYDNINARLQFKWTPDADTTVNLKIFGLRDTGDGPVYIGQYLGGQCDGANAIYNNCSASNVAAPDSPNSRQTYSTPAIYEDYDSYGATLKIDHKLGTMALTSITGWQAGHYRLGTNDTGTAGDLFHSHQQSHTDQASQELRLATNVSSPLRAIFGVYGSYDHVYADQGSASDASFVPAAFQYYNGGTGEQWTTSLAAFTSVTYAATDKLTFIGGLRYSYEHKLNHTAVAGVYGQQLTDADISYPAIIARLAPTDGDVYGDQVDTYRVSGTWRRLTWDATADYKFGESAMVFAKVASGFRSGGFPVGITSPGLLTRLAPETVVSYEIGLKSEWLDRKLRFNASAYYMPYSNMQVQTPNQAGPGLLVSNAGSAHVKGAEAEVELVPTKALHLSATLGYTDAKFVNYLSNFGQLAGNRLPYAPEWTTHLAGSYDLAVDADHNALFETNWSYHSTLYFDPYNFASTSDTGKWTGDLQASYGTTAKGWRFTAFVRNVTNREPKIFGYSLGYVSPTIYGPKRTWGARANFDF